MKNRQIQFWRIVFTYMIAYYHLNNAYGKDTSWYIAVEFFFIVSGWLLAMKCVSMQQSGTLESYPAWKYTLSKFVKFFPHCLFSFLVAFALKGLYRGFGLRDWVRETIFHIPEIFLVQMSGLNYGTDYPINSVTWYMSVLLIVGYFIWYFLRKYPKVYIEVICPLSILIIYPYLYRTYGFIGEHWEANRILIHSALLRGFADMNLGIIAYILTDKLKVLKIKDINFEIISDVCLLFGGVLMPYLYNKTYYDFLFTFLIFIGVVVGFGVTESRMLDIEGKLIDKWALITPAIFLNHKVFRNVFVRIWPECKWYVYLLWFVFITVYSIFTYWLVGKIVELLKKDISKKEPRILKIF